MLELAAERRRDTSDLSRLGLEIVEARPNDSLHRVGQRQRPARLRRRPRRRAATPRPARRSARHTCSRKNGLPPVRSKTRATSAPTRGRRQVPASMIAADGGEIERLERNARCCRQRAHRRRPRSGRVVTMKSSPLRRDDLPHPARARRATRCRPSASPRATRRACVRCESTVNSAASASTSAACRCSPCRWRGSGCDSLRHRQEMQIQRQERLERGVDRADSAATSVRRVDRARAQRGARAPRTISMNGQYGATSPNARQRPFKQS